ncbi:RNA polymerase sporulation sigma factor SigH [Lachnoclostridium sp. An169]|uniref:RNA polymerase sporulation sigma factor SigH n=1 Tax=Lachnoclostridium sp. An169 TaxID=1965569 RepID=UPI0023B98550
MEGDSRENQMGKYERLTDEQLIRKLREGDRNVMDYIMVKYKSMVKRKARAMYLIGGDNDDLIQEGMIGLIKAVRDYDLSQGTSFSSFAELCVSRQMYSAIEMSKRKKHLPLNSYVSLYEESDTSADDGRKTPLIDTIEPPQENDPEKLYFSREYTEAFVEQLKDSLSPLENHVLYLHLMGTDYRTIAELLGKSPKSIDNALQRIRGKAEKMLQSPD